MIAMIASNEIEIVILPVFCVEESDAEKGFGGKIKLSVRLDMKGGRKTSGVILPPSMYLSGCIFTNVFSLVDESSDQKVCLFLRSASSYDDGVGPDKRNTVFGRSSQGQNRLGRCNYALDLVEIEFGDKVALGISLRPSDAYAVKG